MLSRIRALAYKRGYRPKPGTLLYSPSLDMVYGFKDKPLTLKGVDFDGDTVLKFNSIFTPEQAAVMQANVRKFAESVSVSMKEAGETLKKNLRPAFDSFWNVAMKDPEVRLAYWESYVQDEESSNPWPAGTDVWHLWNLRGKSWGHTESYTKGPRGDEWVVVVYTAGMFRYNVQRALNDVSTVREVLAKHMGVAPDQLELALFEVPDELKDDDVATDA